MSKTFFLNFNQINRDIFVKKFANTLPNNTKVLDVGAGSAPYRHLFTHCNYKTHDFKKLDKNQLLFKKGYSQIDIVSDITSLPIKDDEYDVIICTEVMEHIPFPIKSLKEMTRVLKPNGKILLTAPQGSFIHQEPYHFYGGYTKYFYEKFLTENNYKDIQIEENKGFYFFIFQELLRYVKLSSSNLLLFLLNILIFPLIIFLIVFLFFFREIMEKLLDTNWKYTVGYFVTAVKK